MKMFQTQRNTFIHNREILPESIVCELSNGTILVGSDFKNKKGKKLPILFYVPKTHKWYLAYQSDEFTDAMYNFYRKINKKKARRKTNFSALMTHDRVHKHGSGGSRIRKFCGQVTDYECTKNPLHDFKRVHQ